MIAKANRIYKYILPVLAAVVLCLVLLPGMVKAEDEVPTSGTCGENLNWSYADGTLSIETTSTITHMDTYSSKEVAPWNEYYKDDIKKVIIKIGDYGTIGAYAFAGCSSLESVEILAGDLDEIGAYAFNNCTSLTTIKNIDQVTNIGNSAFNGCTSLTAFTMPKNVESVPQSAFYGCSNLETVDLNKAMVIGGSAFNGCKSLTTIKNIDFVKTIESWAFCGCTAFTNFTMPKDVESVPENAFWNCSNLETVDLKQATAIGSSAFYGCKSLTTIKNIDKVTSIGDSAFSGCAALTTFTMPTEVRAVPKSAFSGCSNLKTVNLNIATTIGASAFSDCKSLTTVENIEKVTSIGSSAFSGCTSLTDFSIPASLQTISDKTFNGCTSLETINFNHASANIGASAFAGCTSLKNIVNADNITVIGTSAFSNCKSLLEYAIPNKAATLGANAFANCTGLRKVYLPESLTTIEGRNASNSPFFGCSSQLILFVQAEKISSGWNYYYQYYNNNYGSFRVLMGIAPEVYTLCNPNNPDLTTVDLSLLSAVPNYAFENCSALETVILNPKENTTIGISAFSGCSSLKTIENMQNVTSIGSSAFSGCKSLTSVQIPKKITAINNSVFKNCAGLESVILDSEAKIIIGESAFFGCTSLKTIENLQNVTSIGAAAFSGCTSLDEFRVPKGIASIGKKTFENCSALKKVYIPESVTNIDTGDYASQSPFYGCSATLVVFFESSTNDFELKTDYAKEAMISCGVGSDLYDLCAPNEDILQVDLSAFTNVPDYAFYNSSGLKEITVPSNVASIGDYAFNKSSDLQKATFYSADCAIAENAFGDNANPLLFYAAADSNPYDYGKQNSSKNIRVKELSVCETHTADMLDYYPAEAATCTHTGYEEYWKCKICGTIFSDENGQTISSKKMIEMIDHTPADAVFENEIEANCENTGSYDEVIYCTECGTEISRTPIVVEKLPHNMETHLVAKNETCTEDGNIEYWGCSICGKYYSDEAGATQLAENEWIIPATGHSWGEPEYTWLDDNSSVTASRVCTICGEIETETKPVNEVTVPATCDTTGSNAWTSDAFENPAFTVQTKNEVIPALGHEWGEWVVTLEPTETENGTKIRVCSRDEAHKDSQIIPHIGHVHSLIKTEMSDSTCTEDGNIEYWQCIGTEDSCGLYFADENATQELSQDSWIIPGGHKLEEVDRVEPTCINDGCEEYWRCTVCEKIFADKNGETELSAVPVLALTGIHTPGEPVRENEIPATSTKEGSYEEVIYCNVCKEELSREKKIEPKKPSTITLSAKTVTYNTKAQKIGKAKVTGSTGEVTYKYYKDNACKEEIKASQVKNAGTYYVKALVTADSKYKGATSKAVKLIIKPNNKKQKVKLLGKTKTTYALTYKKNGKLKINATSTGDGKLKFKSSNTKVVKVNQKGKVTIVGSGTATITIQAKKTKNCTKASAVKTIKVMVHPYELLKSKSGVYFIHITDPSFNKNKNEVPDNTYGIKVKYADTKKPKKYSTLKSNQAQLQYLKTSAKAKKGTITIYFKDFKNNYETVSHVTVKDFKLDKKNVYVKLK